MTTDVTVSKDVARIEFFEHLFDDREGYICIAHAPITTRRFTETYFKWPVDVDSLIAHIKKVEPGHNVWMCAQLLEQPERKKHNIYDCRALWADLDRCDPSQISPKPTAILESSNGRWQAYWRLQHLIPATLAEDYSCRIAYAYRDYGADTSGWDLTQLLRVPFTSNYKYAQHPIVSLDLTDNSIDPAEFNTYPRVEHYSVEWEPAPSRILDAETVLAKYGAQVPDWIMVREPQPGEDWSKHLWRVLLTLFEAGLSREEVYGVASAVPCNKFARDGRPERLWGDILRAEAKYLLVQTGDPVKIKPPQVLADDYKPTVTSFVEVYKDWAGGQSDAPIQYHEAAAFAILSALCSGGLEIETNIGNIKTNLWILVLGETTTTRKTTAMRTATKLIEDVDENVLLATEEGSLEGILDALQTRPHKASLFWRDEVVGMIKGIAKKDYLAGMLETFTKLYDGNTVRRLLRKDVITVKEPIFIFFGGGIKNSFMSALNEEHLTSGFLPRFLFVVGEADIHNMRPLGARTDSVVEGRDNILAAAIRLHNNFNAEKEMTIGGTTNTISMPVRVLAELTAEAWDRYNQFDRTMTLYAHESHNREQLLPVVARQSMSMLKMAALIAASKRQPNAVGRLEVTVEDIDHAIYYIEKWFPYTLEVIRGAGSTASERMIENVIGFIHRNPGVLRSAVMRNYKLSAYDMKNLQQTMQERNMIRVEKVGKGEYLYATS